MRSRDSILRELTVATTFVVVCFCVVADVHARRPRPSEEAVVVLPVRTRNGNFVESQYRAVSADINNDGVPDQRRYLDANGTLVVTARDLDFDGQFDLFEYYQGNQIIEHEFQLDFDTEIDVVCFYSGGQLVRREMSTTFTGALNLVQFFGPGSVLERVERDDDANGMVDVWEYYAGGELSQIGRDTTGDGIADSIIDVE
jgi:hypothetical protein